jgi:hypothetical protein
VSTGAKDHLLANALACHGNDTIRVFDQMRGYGIRTPGHCTDVRPDDVHVQLKSVRPVHPDEYTKTSGCTGRTRPGVPGVRVRVYVVVIRSYVRTVSRGTRVRSQPDASCTTEHFSDTCAPNIEQTTVSRPVHYTSAVINSGNTHRTHHKELIQVAHLNDHAIVRFPVV